MGTGHTAVKIVLSSKSMTGEKIFSNLSSIWLLLFPALLL